MKKGICFYFGYESDPEDRIKLLKKIGFDCVIANADKKFDYQNGSIASQVKLFKRYNLQPSSLHMTYNSTDLPYFWQEGRIGDKLTNNLIKDVKIAHKYGFSCVVVHLKGVPNPIGIKRLNKVLTYCEKYNIPLAIENLLTNKEIFCYTFNNIKSDYLKFCFDIGHQNVSKEGYDFLNNHLDKLYCVHLHSNMGDKDRHTLNKYGNVNWEDFAKVIATLNIPINLDYEIFMIHRENETEEEVAQTVYNQAVNLQILIEYYKKHIK